MQDAFSFCLLDEFCTAKNFTHTTRKRVPVVRVFRNKFFTGGGPVRKKGNPAGKPVPAPPSLPKKCMSAVTAFPEISFNKK
ncbi:MAG: hypothetical protein C6P37_01285 [Caldibacillus debilis]|uniref:Uncharacterized protein n=1 Tax=Caldibacillus debilis TaxID=301148 RepID=A0A3E0K894_9BACI|nr:MAG: hypothetical protein C6P37_01285 [Caldibacillus debilis]